MRVGGPYTITAPGTYQLLHAAAALRVEGLDAGGGALEALPFLAETCPNGDPACAFTRTVLGTTARRALVRDVLPNVGGPILVLAMLDLATAILLLSGLSFLGLGAQPPTPEWGAMVAEGAQNFNDWWVGMFPGLAILTVVLAFNFIGDALRDMLDPRTARAVRL